jgi:hypothetical protein
MHHSMAMLAHEKLDVYRCALEFLAGVGQVVDTMPVGTAVLRDQIERASLSIVANIAEGVDRCQYCRGRWRTHAQGTRPPFRHRPWLSNGMRRVTRRVPTPQCLLNATAPTRKAVAGQSGLDAHTDDCSPGINHSRKHANLWYFRLEKVAD